MDYCSHYLELVTEFAAIHQLPEQALTPEKFLWIRFRDEIPLLLGVWQETHLFVELEIGRPCATEEGAFYGQALAANWNSAELKNAQWCINPKNGHLTLRAVRPTEEIADAHQLEAWFTDLGNLAATWQQKTKGTNAQPLPETPSAVPDFHFHNPAAFA